MYHFSKTLDLTLTARRLVMKKTSFLIGLLISGILLLTPTCLFSATRGISVVSKQGQKVRLYSDYYALVVGISDYEWWPKLPNAANDAKEVAQKLKKMGFKVTLKLDLTSREMDTALSELVYKIGNDRNRAVLFYYAGHGETETLADRSKMGYIIPADCPIKDRNPMGFATHAISMRDIESASLRIQARHVLMLFDSCFSGSLFALVRAVPHDVSEKSSLPVRQYITAGREDEVVPDKSMFKRTFLIGLEGDADLTGDGYITGSELGMYLSDKVVNYTHRQQHPQYGKINNPDLDRGDFIFVPVRVQAAVAAEEKRLFEKESARARELETMREKMKKNEELMEQMKRLLEAKLDLQKKEKARVDEKARLEKQISMAREERDKNKQLMEARIKALESERNAAEEKARKELAEQRALRAELKRKAEKVRLDEKTNLEKQTSVAGEEQDENKQLMEAGIKALEAERKAAEEKARKEAAEKMASHAELKDKKDIEQELERLRRERKKNQQSTETRIKDLEAERKVAEAKAQKEAADKKTTEKKIQRLDREMKTASKTVDKPKGKQPGKRQLAYIPKEVKDGKISKIRLRHEPKEIVESGIQEMILKNNFFSKKTNAAGSFRNDFVDNGDGTITDRSTGLMWEKQGSSYRRRCWGATGHVEDLNGERFLGHNDWRVPTLEELLSLMRPKVRQTGQYIDPLFDEEQSVCWSSDRSTDWERENAYYVDFSSGVIEVGYGSAEGARYEITVATSFVKAVRTVK